MVCVLLVILITAVYVTNAYDFCFRLSDTVIIVVCVLGALLVIIIAGVLIMCIINSKKRDRVVRIRHPRRGQDHGKTAKCLILPTFRTLFNSMLY